MKVEGLERYGVSGWQWTQAEREWHTGRVVRETYRTNGHGTGLWRETYTAYGSYDGWRQIAGTAQFAAPQAARAMRRAIHRYDLMGVSC